MGERGAADPQKVRTIREKAHALAAREGSVLSDAPAAISAAPVVEASGPASYFLSGTPPEARFSVSDLPLAGGLEWLSSNGGSVFIEIDAPEVRGLGWGTLLTRATEDPVGLVDGVSRAGLARGVDVEHDKGDPGLLVMDPGLMTRAGILLYLEDEAGVEANRGFYEHLFGSRFSVEEPPLVLHIACLVEMDGEDFGSGREALIEPSVIWYLPVEPDGHVTETSGDSDELMLLAPGAGSTEDLEEVMDYVSEGQQPVILSALFSVACLGAATPSRNSSSRVERLGSDGIGAVYRLRMGSLARTLDERGRAPELGLSHALTVCREDFEGAFGEPY